MVNKKEIDLLITKDQKIYPIEIKKTGSPTKNALKNFKVLNTVSTTIEHGAVICLVDTLIPLNNKVDALPIGLI